MADSTLMRGKELLCLLIDAFRIHLQIAAEV